MNDPSVCSFCSEPLLDGDRFCPACGRGMTERSLATEDRQVPTGAPPPPPSSLSPAVLWAAAWAFGAVLNGLRQGMSGVVLVSGGLWFLGGLVAGAGSGRALYGGRGSPSPVVLLATAVGWAFLLGLSPWIGRLASAFNPPYLLRDLLTGLILVGVAAAAGAWLTARSTSPDANSPPIRPASAAVGWGAGAAFAILLQLALNHF